MVTHQLIVITIIRSHNMSQGCYATEQSHAIETDPYCNRANMITFSSSRLQRVTVHMFFAYKQTSKS